MKFLHLFLVFFILCGCQAVHVTKQYYDEYVNPKASIDYESLENADIPSKFMDEYYKVDSKLTAVRNKLDMVELSSDAEWIRSIKAVNPWIKNIAFFDNDKFFVTGSDALAFDSDLRTILEDISNSTGTYMRQTYDKSLMINIVKVGVNSFRYAIIDIDFDILFAGVSSEKTLIMVDKEIVYGQNSSFDTEKALKYSSDRCDYSGAINIDDLKLYWIRSLASDNLVYFYNN